MNKSEIFRTFPQWKSRFLNKSITARELIFIAALLFCISPVGSPPLALILGFLIAQFIGHPYIHLNNKATHYLLQFSVVGLGFGMNVHSALKASSNGILFTILSLIFTMIMGLLIGKWLKIEPKTSYLVSVGTAICGGSAIASISPIIKAREKEISVALGIIFLLNSMALFLFPFLGRLLNLSEIQFGTWCALAIHDTSSVVGAASKYGPQALEVATTVKLARALWILPFSLLSIFLFKNKEAKVKWPYFIGFFIIALIMNTYIPSLLPISKILVMTAKSGLTLTIFLIGCGLSGKVIQSVGIKPFIQGVGLWILISICSLLVILKFIS
jgi:uncharacterized integral membrane protein (TIGR00698 family)